MSTIDIRLLGPVEVMAGGTRVLLRGSRQREVVALLALHLNEVVSRDALIDELWEHDPPPTAAKIVQNAVSQLRKGVEAAAGEAAAIATEPAGYVLHADPERLDVRRFERLADAGKDALEAGDARAAREQLRSALALWRGRALVDVAEMPFAQAEAVRLEELRLAAIEDRTEADLALGRHADVTGELEALVAQHPLRERLRGHLMLVLYRLGRQADALAVYQDTRRTLVDTLGIEPSPFLQRLERSILRQEPELEAPPVEPRTHPVAPVARAVRKTVTVLVAEVAPPAVPTDPEALARWTQPVLDVAQRVAEAHGATVQRLPGASILAVYGVPAVREDDALRAARAALELREELAGDGHPDARVRIGVSAGEVIVDAGGHVSGQPVVAAVRLQQRAAPGDVLVCAGTERLLRAAGSLERVPTPVEEEPVWRLVELSPDVPAVPRRLETPLVGRARELEQLHQALARATGDRTTQLVTVLGPAGIGKSRLAAEFVGAVAGETCVLSGRCASYGHGMTFRPLAEMLGSQLADPEGLPRLLADDPGASLFLSQTAGAIGLTERASTPTETFWAVRRLLEALARRQPLVAVVDDIHWAEALFLDLIEHIGEWARTAPILLLCLARPEILDNRPGWGGGKVNATTILLEPLSDQESAALIDELPGGATLETTLRTRLAAAAEGNPLFLEQTLALLREEPPTGERLPVPPTIQGLLAARLDRLPPQQRALVEYAAVIGRDFGLEALSHLAAEVPASELAVELSEVVRKDLIRPAGIADEAEAFRFRHMLIRAAAYESLPKAERARLHEALAGWLEERDGPAEVTGYHLEEAHRYRAELEPTEEGTRVLGRRAATALGEAGRRASARGDVPAAVRFLSRAVSLADERTPEWLELLGDLAEALRDAGEFARAQEVAEELAEAAAAAGDRRLEAHAALVRVRSQLQTDPRLAADAAGEEIARAIVVFEEEGDDARLAKAWELLAWPPWRRGKVAEAEAALRQAIDHARRAGDRRIEAQALNLLVGAALYGPLAVPEGVELCRSILDRFDDQQRVRASAMRALAALSAMQGNFDEARRLLVEQRAILADLGLVVTAAWTAETLGLVELLAGDPEAAERELRAGYETLERLGETSNLSNLAAMIAHALHAQGRPVDAVAFTALSEQASAPDDVSAQVLWRTARAKALAATGRAHEAERLARDAVALAEQTDFLILHADAVADLGEVALASDIADAAAIVERARQLYEKKGNVVSAARLRELLAQT